MASAIIRVNIGEYDQMIKVETAKKISIREIRKDFEKFKILVEDMIDKQEHENDDQVCEIWESLGYQIEFINPDFEYIW